MASGLQDKVVVITGASSGIGRATAKAFAHHGAWVVLAARRQTALQEVARECIAEGGRAMVIPTDVSDEDQVHTLARRAIDSFGGIDIWFNNAGILQFGRFEDTPPDIFNRVIQTNLLGTVHGSRAVLPHFRQRGHGVLINMASMASWVAQPYSSAYSASKFAVRGFSETLWEEFLDQPDIHVCLIHPGPIDTPLWQHAANYTGQQIQALSPIYPPKLVADLVVGLALKPRREVFAGSAARLGQLQYRLAPGLTERAFRRQMDLGLFRGRPAAPTAGNTLRPMPEYTGEDGGWGGREAIRTRRSAGLIGLLALAVPLGLYAWQRRRAIA